MLTNKQKLDIRNHYIQCDDNITFDDSVIYVINKMIEQLKQGNIKDFINKSYLYTSNEFRIEVYNYMDEINQLI